MKIQRLETGETADVDMEADEEDDMETKPAAPLASDTQEAQQQRRPLGLQLPTVERISESPFEQSSASTVFRASLDKDEPASSSNAGAGGGGFRPFFNGILSRVRGDSGEKSRSGPPSGDRQRGDLASSKRPAKQQQQQQHTQRQQPRLRLSSHMVPCASTVYSCEEKKISSSLVKCVYTKFK